MDDYIKKAKEAKKRFLSKSLDDSIEQIYTLGYLEGVNDASENIQAAQLKAAAKAASIMLSMQRDIDEFIKEVTEDE
jgi:flagellar biosynthesis/type III secretory pathway protein FliH